MPIMTMREKYDRICDMNSIGGGNTMHTFDKYPTFTEFKRALRQGRVCGDYGRSIRIVSNNPNNE